MSLSFIRVLTIWQDSMEEHRSTAQSQLSFPFLCQIWFRGMCIQSDGEKGLVRFLCAFIRGKS